MACLALGACKRGLDEASVRAVAQAGEDASKQSNFDQMTSLISDDCQMHETAPKQDGTKQEQTKSCKQGIDEQRKQIGDAVAGGAVRTYEYTITSVTIEGDKGTAKIHASDSLAQGGNSLKADADEVETVQLRNGKAVITHVDVTVTGVEVNGRRVL